MIEKNFFTGDLTTKNLDINSANVLVLRNPKRCSFCYIFLKMTAVGDIKVYIFWNILLE